MKIEIGQNLKTNYGTGPYKVTGIVRNCTCTHILDEIEGVERPLPPHVHMFVDGIGNDHNAGGHFYLNYFSDETLESVVPGSSDKLIFIENTEPVQRSLIFS